MELKINIPEYNGEKLQSNWDSGFEIKTAISTNKILISANKAGLVSLAKHLLTLAQHNVPTGSHFHFDEYNSLENGSKELIIEKIEC